MLVYSINNNDLESINEIKSFLYKNDMTYEDTIDYTIVIKEGGRIIATASKTKDVFMCFAIDANYKGCGITQILITELNNQLFKENIYHSFVFTKLVNKEIFLSLGYSLIYEEDKVCMLENGLYNINKFINIIICKYGIDTSFQRASIVMNCNPFTKGHRYLIERASKENKEVLVFVVFEDAAIFPFEERLEMVRRGVQDLNNVKVMHGYKYIISNVTFPTYFLKTQTEINKSYMNLDAGIFASYFCKRLNINVRYVGHEPYCEVTNQYNNILNAVLKRNGLTLKVIERKSFGNEFISATRVRSKLINNEGDLNYLLPQSTIEFLNTSRGKEIIDKLKNTIS